jgi:copper chaperone
MMKFKTNIKCGGCIQTVKPYLDSLKEITSWEVDTSSPDRTLSIEGEIPPEKVIQAIQAAGYRAEKIS